MAQPWFKFWAKDYLADGDIAALSYERRGILQTLWSYSWEGGSIPSAPEDLADILHLDASAMRTHCDWLKRFFVPHPSDPSRWISPRQELERDEAEKRGCAARFSAKKRWERHLESMRTHSEGIAKALPTQCEPHAYQNQKQSTKITPTPSPSAAGTPPPEKPGKPEKTSKPVKKIRRSYLKPESREAFEAVWTTPPKTWRKWDAEKREFVDEPVSKGSRLEGERAFQAMVDSGVESPKVLYAAFHAYITEGDGPKRGFFQAVSTFYGPKKGTALEWLERGRQLVKESA